MELARMYGKLVQERTGGSWHSVAAAHNPIARRIHRTVLHRKKYHHRWDFGQGMSGRVRTKLQLLTQSHVRKIRRLR